MSLRRVEVEVSNDIAWRLRACLLIASLDFIASLFTPIKAKYYFLILIIVLLINLAIYWKAIRGVRFPESSEDFSRCVNSAKRWVLIIGFSAAILAVAIAFLRSFERQAIPFFIFGYTYIFLIIPKIIDLAIDRRIGELSDSE